MSNNLSKLPSLSSTQILTDAMMEQIENGGEVQCANGCQEACKKSCKNDGRGDNSGTISPTISTK